MANLYLFDVDGTLVDIMGFQLITHRQAYQDVCGFMPRKEELIPCFGLVEKKIHEKILADYGRPKEDAERIVSRRKEIFSSMVGEAEIRVLGGVMDFLGHLERNGELRGVVTGNPRKAGEAILKRSGLYNKFGIFSYGDGVEKRSEIVLNAIKQAGGVEKVIVIGDTPMDIEAGKSAGTMTVGVATGRFSAAELKKATPDIVLNSLKDYPRIVDFVGNLH